MRRVRRLLEGIAEAPETRYLRWMTMFDEPSRLSLYTSEFDDRLAACGGDDPARVLYDALNVAMKRDPVTRSTIADLLVYLPNDLLVKVDMASMANSLETRAPFLDYRVVELALSMPVDRKLRLRGGRSKVVLKEAFADLLPPAIRTRPKMGFGVPLDRWFRNELRDELREVLLDPQALGRGLFREEAIRALIDDHQSGRKDNAYRLWALLMLELWFRTYLDPK